MHIDCLIGIWPAYVFFEEHNIIYTRLPIDILMCDKERTI